MGTRGAFGFLIDGQTKATYNHADSYPDGLGQDVVDYIEQMIRGLPEDPVTLLAKVRALQPVPDRAPTPDEIKRLAPWTNLGVGGQSTSDWYCLLRDAQGDAGAMLETGFYNDGEAFLADSLFCEWAYIINFDKEVFEVYRGFQEVKHDKGRYADMETGGEKYFPVALVASFPLTAIPEDWIAKVEPREEED